MTVSTKFDKIFEVKKKLSVIFSTFLIVFAIAVSVIVFFLPANKRKVGKRDYGVQIFAEDIVISKGEKVENFYTLSRDAEVEIEIENSSLVKIEENNLIALKQGETSLTITASVGESYDSCTIEIQITDDKRIVVSAIENCTIVNDKIFAQQKEFSVNIEFFNNIGKLDNFKYDIVCEDDGVTYSKGFMGIKFTAEHDFSFNITFGDNSKRIEVVFN